MATITSHYANAAVIGAVRKGINDTGLFSRAGIPNQILERDSGRVHTAQMTKLIQQVWRETEDEFMGFFDTACPSGVFAMMLNMVSKESTLDDMFKKGFAFYGFVTDEILMDYEMSDTERTFRVAFPNPHYDRQYFFLEFWLVIWHRMASWLIGDPIPLTKAAFTYQEPAHVQEFQYQFRCPLLFGHTHNQLTFPSEYGLLPLVRSKQEVHEFLKRSPADLMTIPASAPNLTRQVTKLLSANDYQALSDTDMTSICQSLNTSVATLRRKLAEEGTSFQKIKDAIKRDVAIEQLSVHGLPVHKVAERLGFTESRSLTRAFVSWTGVTPSTYRHKP